MSAHQKSSSSLNMMESDDSVTEMLEVPGHFQKPHEIFISEQSDWSFENGAQQETDPLHLEEEKDCEDTGRGGAGAGGDEVEEEEEAEEKEESKPLQMAEADLTIKEEVLELPSASLPPSDFTVKEEKVSSDCKSNVSLNVSPATYIKEVSSDCKSNVSLNVSPAPYIKEIHHSTKPAFISTRRVLLPATGFSLFQVQNSAVKRPPVRRRKPTSGDGGQGLVQVQSSAVTNQAPEGGSSGGGQGLVQVQSSAVTSQAPDGGSGGGGQGLVQVQSSAVTSQVPDGGSGGGGQGLVQVQSSAVTNQAPDGGSGGGGQGNTPESESAASLPVVKIESSPPHVDCDGDPPPESAPIHVDWTAASTSSEQRAADDSVDQSICCSRHRRKWIQYPQMLIIAIMDSPDWKLFLSDIYRVTRRRFPCVRFRKNWQNSIRHVLSVSPIFVKSEHSFERNAYYWSLVPSLEEKLREHSGPDSPYCCKWRMVTELHRDCSQTLPRRSRVPLRRRLESARAEISYSRKSESHERNNNRSTLSSARHSSRVRIRLANSWRKLEHPNVSHSAVDSKMDTGDKLDDSSPPPPLKSLIARAIMRSPDRQVPLSVIYLYCLRHCPYYKDKRRQCYQTIKQLLGSEACFKRLPQEGGRRPDHWTFDMRYKDLSKNDDGQPSGDLADAASSEPWEHDHGLYSKQLQLHSDSGEASSGTRDVGPFRTPDSHVTETASDSNSDTGGARSQLMGQTLRWFATGLGARRAGAQKRGGWAVDDGESELDCSLKKPRAHPLLESFEEDNMPYLDNSFLDNPFDVNDVLDTKDKPLPGESPTEEKREQNMHTTLLNAERYRRVKIELEDDGYPPTLKFEMINTWC